MGLYTEGLKVSIHRQVAKGKTVKEAYGFLTSKLSKALKSYVEIRCQFVFSDLKSGVSSSFRARMMN